MNINFNLATPQAKVSSIRIIVTHKSKVYRKGTGLSTPVKNWSSAKQKTTNVETNKQLAQIHVFLERTLHVNSTPDDIKTALEMAVLSERDRRAYAYRKAGRPSFGEVFCSMKGDNITSMYKTLGELMGEPEWEDITPVWADALMSRMEKRGASVNYIGQMLLLTKQAMKIGLKKKYHGNEEYTDIDIVQEDSFSVYLTREEVDRIWEHHFDKPNLAKARDIFIVGIYTASRHSDYSRLTMDNVHGQLLDFIQTKTGGRVIMPCSPRIVEVMKRHDGRVPKYTRVNMNKLIKEVCREVGIDDVIEVPKSKRKILRKKDGEPVYKWELVGTHTARRTGATLLYLAGVPTIQCMMITGHRTESSFLKYIKVTGEENARALMNCSFFK